MWNSRNGSTNLQAKQNGSVYNNVTQNHQKFNSQKTEKPCASPLLVFKRVPKKCTKEDILEMCKQHGNVKALRQNASGTSFFVDLETEDDMKSIYHAFENKTGFNLIVGDRDHQEQQQNSEGCLRTERKPYETARGLQQSASQLSNSTQNHIKSNGTMSSEKNSMEIKKLMQCNGVTDKTKSAEENVKKIQPLMAVKFPKDFLPNAKVTDEFECPRLTNMSIQTNGDNISFALGTYYDMEEDYQQGDNNTNQIIFDKCIQCGRECGFICGRCGAYFCDKDCQLQAWSQHRYICGKPKQFQLKPSAFNIAASNYNCNNAQTMVLPQSSQSAASTETALSKRRLQSVELPKHTNAVAVALKQTSPSSQNIPKTTSMGLPLTFSSCKSGTLAQTNSSKQPIEITSPTKSDLLKESYSHTQSEIQKATLSTDMTPVNGSIYTITSISKSNIVFLRSKKHTDCLTYIDLIERLQAAAKTFIPLQTKPMPGQIVATLFKEKFRRAMILNTDNLQRIRIVYTEYGDLDCKPCENLYTMPIKLSAVRRFAFPVILKNVEECCMSEELFKFMNSYIDIDFVLHFEPKVSTVDNTVYQVILLEEATNKNFNKMVSTLIRPLALKTKNICFPEYLNQKTLPTGNNIDLVIMDNSLLVVGSITCSTKEGAFEIQKMQSELQRYAQTVDANPYEPRVDELCIVKNSFDGSWYRGRCLEIIDKQRAFMVIIDYGSTKMVSFAHIRTYPQNFRYPIYVCDCDIAGIPQNNNQLVVDFLKKLLLNGSVIRCERIVAHADTKLHTIKLPDVVVKLSNFLSGDA